MSINKYLDYFFVIAIIFVAVIFLIRNYSKSRKSCASMCGGCESRCTQKVIKYKP